MLPDAIEINILSIQIDGKTYHAEGLIFRAEKPIPPVPISEAQREQESYPRDPMAKSIADLVTPKQLGMIRALARECKVDADGESNKVLGCKTDELSKRAASSLIDHLKELQRQVA